MSHPGPIPIEVQIRQIRLEAEGIASYELSAVDRGPLPAFTAGAHIDLHLPGELIRSYSLINDPKENHRYVIAVQREAQSRGGSSWMHSVPRVGDVLEISPPTNDFLLAEGAIETIFFAGGIGITPMMSMARRLNELGRPWQLYYGARSRDLAAFQPEIVALAGTARQPEFRFGLSADDRFDMAGIVRQAADDTHFYCCGPAPMIDAYLSACSDRPATHVHYERFSASNEAATGGGFEVILKRSGRHIDVKAGKTILDALIDHGVEVQYACSEGVCGTCRTGVESGVPDHRDDYLTAEEKALGKSIMVCCSGSKTKTLVLDL